MVTERPCWGPAGSGSKCYSAICSNQLNSCPFVHFEQTSRPGRQLVLTARSPRPPGLHSGCGPASEGALPSVIRASGCVLGVAASSSSSPLDVSCLILRGWQRAARCCGCVGMLVVAVGTPAAQSSN